MGFATCSAALARPGTAMHWIAPSENDLATDTLENRLWAAADQLRANSGLSAAHYSQPVLGLIFLRFAEQKSTLDAQIPNLRQTHDLLLPRLLSGLINLKKD